MQVPVPASEPIFTYFDGVQHVFADPWPLHRAWFAATRGEPNRLANLVYAIKPDTTDKQVLMDGYAAMTELEDLVRLHFHMKPFNPLTGQGAQWPHCLAAWEQFATFMTEAKKKTETTPTTSSPSESSPVAPSPTPT